MIFLESFQTNFSIFSNNFILHFFIGIVDWSVLLFLIDDKEEGETASNGSKN